MNTKQSFVGAHSRNRRGGRLAAVRPDIASGAAAAAPPSETTAAAPDQAAANREAAATVADSYYVADTLSPAASVWMEAGANEFLRVDTPVAEPSVEPRVPTVDQRHAAEPPPADDQAASDGTPDDTAVAFGVGVGLPHDSGNDAPETIETGQPIPQHARGADDASAPPRWNGAHWEVDAFDIPKRVAELFFDEPFFGSVAKQIHQSVRTGLGSMLITSRHAGDGRSTVAIGTAIAAAATGLRVALVDLDLDTPDLADTMRLDTDVDWIAAVRRDDPLESVAVASLEDSLTLLPLTAGAEATLAATSADVDRLLDRLTECFHLVIFDGPVGGHWVTEHIAPRIDSCLMVRDVRRPGDAAFVAHTAGMLRQRGVPGIGAVANFCAENRG